jgi:hypothetical protein
MALATQDAAALARRLLDAHRETCPDPTCPYVDPGRPLIVAERFSTDGDSTNGSAHRHHYSDIGTLGEHIGHLAIPEIRLVDPLSPIPGVMDGVSPQGATEIKTATLQRGPDGELQRAYTIRPTQRQPHALPALFVALERGFVSAFDGRPLELPPDLPEVLRYVEGLHVVPLAAYPHPQRTFIIPAETSSRPRTRALQTLFSYSLTDLQELGLHGLGRIRAIFDSPASVAEAMDYLGEVLEQLDPDELREYRLDPRQVAADARAFQAGVAPNARVSEALAIREIRQHVAERRRRREAARREQKERRQAKRRREQREDRVELAFALIGILTTVAGRPISALERPVSSVSFDEFK